MNFFKTVSPQLEQTLVCLTFAACAVVVGLAVVTLLSVPIEPVGIAHAAAQAVHAAG
ncbi:MAG TPA: hypothetical protein VF271_07895 [Rhodanobacteraceae bacterium]